MIFKLSIIIAVIIFVNNENIYISPSSTISFIHNDSSYILNSSDINYTRENNDKVISLSDSDKSFESHFQFKPVSKYNSKLLNCGDDVKIYSIKQKKIYKFRIRSFKNIRKYISINNRKLRKSRRNYFQNNM